ncbi:Transcription factor SRM1 [Camellia lanceoleosa]|uniref:Transcription factor SRM1 n=1 Tax=Camellia lanceoleosa TaxID=1840588 RepID=A0ACC0IZI9_9ERIC|nr:Transcription factor SRM1 [Camellia lanceoleosa]
MAAVEADEEEDLLAFEKKNLSPLQQVSMLSTEISRKPFQTDPYQRMSTNGTSSSSSWTREQDKAFENALAIFSEESGDRWEKVAAMVPGKTVEEIKHHYEILVEDINAIESDLVPLPHYKDSASRAGDFGVGEEGSQFGQMQSDSRHGGKSSRSDQERRRGIAWTEEEHRLFLLGLEKYGKGDWKGISRNFVVSRTPTQVASHAQKYFIRQSSANRERRRTSIHDITSVCGGDTSSTPQGQIMGQVDGVATMAKPTLSDPHLISAVGVPVDHPSLAEMLSDVRAPTPGSLVSGTSKDMPPMTYLQPHSSDQK